MSTETLQVLDKFHVEISRRIESMDYWGKHASPGFQAEMYRALASELRSLKDYVETQIVIFT